MPSARGRSIDMSAQKQLDRSLLFACVPDILATPSILEHQ